ncbi:hypothetical protein ACFQ1S_29595 [Kibdelosporangium lantanae]|uniref:Uncharacterized protein n=1 Tax=Kibdelosporangium lantanae TaxID=1497396 RepID=A0ABW3MF89_9PSEU
MNETLARRPDGLNRDTSRFLVNQETGNSLSAGRPRGHPHRVPQRTEGNSRQRRCSAMQTHRLHELIGWLAGLVG